MKPIKFKEVNIIYAEDQKEYIPLPALKYTDKEGTVVSCWKLSWRERFKIFFRGTMWLRMLTFQKPLTPVILTVEKSEVIDESQFNN